MTPDTLDALVERPEVKRVLGIECELSTLSNPIYYVLASDYDSLRSSLARLTEANERANQLLKEAGGDITNQQACGYEQPNGWHCLPPKEYKRLRAWEKWGREHAKPALKLYSPYESTSAALAAMPTDAPDDAVAAHALAALSASLEEKP